MTASVGARPRRASNSSVSRSRPKNNQESSGPKNLQATKRAVPGPVFCRDRSLGRRWVAKDIEKSPDLLRGALPVAKVDVLLLLDKRRKLRRVRTLAQHRDQAESFAIAGVAYKTETNLPIDPGLDAQTADVHDHRGGIRNGLFESCHPGVSRLQIVFVEPDVEAVAAEDFRELARRLCVCAGVTEKHVALARSLSYCHAHPA